MKKTLGFFGRIAAFFRNLFASRKEVAVAVEPASEETFLEEPVEEKAEKVTNRVVVWGARVIAAGFAYIVVMNFPLTILLIMELVAVYKAMTWAANKAIANA